MCMNLKKKKKKSAPEQAYLLIPFSFHSLSEARSHCLIPLPGSVCSGLPLETGSSVGSAGAWVQTQNFGFARGGSSAGLCSRWLPGRVLCHSEICVYILYAFLNTHVYSACESLVCLKCDNVLA